MIEYLKIDTPFNRDNDGTKNLIEGSWRSETVEFLAPCDWICTEKIDGTNIGIVWDGHKVTFQGRTERAVIPPHLLEKLTQLFGGNEVEEMFEQKFGEKNVILFGEGYGVKIQNGGNYRSDVSFILFDVYMPDANLWLKRDSVEDIAKAFGIDVVPIVMVGSLYDAISFVKNHPKSTIGKADMEGLVCRPKIELHDRTNKRIIVKVKACDFEGRGNG